MNTGRMATTRDVDSADKADPRFLIALVGAGVLTIALLWLLPAVGFVAAAVMLIIAPPWGRSLTERAIVSGVVLLGLTAVVFPRAGSTPVTAESARLALTALTLGVLALRAVPRLRFVPIPRPTLSDGLVGALALVSGIWLMSAYIGRNAYEIVAGLFFSGWDNQGHFTTFANTYVAGSTTWPTVDGSIAWNQWYPSLHTTVWSLAELALNGGGLDRPGLLWPYVLWSAVTFALCLGALAWVAGDLAARFGGTERERFTRPLAVTAFAVFGLLGTPALLFNSGFTNFALAVTVMVVAAYLSARSLRSARVLGWFLIPLAGLAVIGLWTPLVLGLVPSAVVVAIALLRYNRWLGIGWLVASAALAAFLGVTQTAAILGVEPGQSTGDFASQLGEVTTGMSPFNVGAALLAPVVVALFAVLLIRRRMWPTAVAVIGPVAGAGLIALVFAAASDSADVSRLQSYYVLKPLNAMLLAVAPVIAALGAVALVRALAGARRATAIVATVAAGAITVALFGYVGVTPDDPSGGFEAAPGIEAGADRMYGIEDPLIGESIIRAQQAARPHPDRTTMLWDGSGTLPNLWVASLHGTLSKAQQRFYADLPPFPYEESVTGYLDLTLTLNPTMDMALLWFRPSTGKLLEPYVASRGDDRVIAVQVPMPPNAMCPECAPLAGS